MGSFEMGVKGKYIYLNCVAGRGNGKGVNSGDVRCKLVLLGKTFSGRRNPLWMCMNAFYLACRLVKCVCVAGLRQGGFGDFICLDGKFFWL